MPGVDELLDRIDGPRCVCSNSSSERLQITLEKTRLYDRFAPYIFSAVEVGDKRAEAVAERLSLRDARQFGIDPREMLVIEDSVFGVTRGARRPAPASSASPAARHTWPGHADLLTEAGAETVIKRFADLPAIAEALMSWEGMAD